MTPIDRRRLPILRPEYWAGRPSPRRGRTFPPEVLTPEEIHVLMRVCGRPGRARARYAALMAVMMRSGLRVSEALSLLPSDIDTRRHIVHVRRGKGSVARRVPIDDGALAVVAAWRVYRDALDLPLGTPLFCTYQRDVFGPPGRRVGTAQVREALHRAAEKAGLEKRVTPHAFRHTFAFELMLEGKDLLTISMLLGHRSTATTDAYLRHIAPIRLVDTILARDPWLPEELVAA